MVETIKDIFISYRNDGSGNQFAYRLCMDLEQAGYSVYFNPNESGGKNFPERLKTAISNCNDLLLVLSPGCLERLMHNDEVDWVREEVLTAQKLHKNIIPLLIEDVELPRTAAEMPEEIRFLLDIDAIRIPEQYLIAPFSMMEDRFDSKKGDTGRYRKVCNSNPNYDLNEDYRQTLEAAQSGDVRAIYDVGIMYFYGMPTTDSATSHRDYDRCAYWMKKVAETEDELKYQAHEIIARLYYQGSMPGEPLSYEKSLEHYKLAAAGSAHSTGQISFMERCGLGCEFDYEKIISDFSNGVVADDDVAIMNQANFCAQYGKYKDAIKLYNSMKNLSPEAAYQIGMLYKRGLVSEPPKPDYIYAEHYLRLAADQNHAQAAFEYGEICFKPTGNFRLNLINAEKYLLIAAEGGIVEAMYYLGYFYDVGLITKDHERAIYYHEKAVEHGHTYSALDLSRLYQEPEHLNYRKAFEMARMAASHGVGEALMMYGNFLFWGRGCEPDLNLAEEMYRKAYDNGNYLALLMLEKLQKVRGNDNE